MEKDYSKYFTKPSLQDAKRRGKEEVRIIKDGYEIPSAMKNIGASKLYHIKTYGCQANERDTETLCGIFESLGYTWTDDFDNADVILLNTCAIRENAEQKVFGKVGYVKKLKKTNPELIFGICGCMSQEESVIKRILEKHQHVDLIFGTHNIHRLPQLLMEAILDKEKVIEVWSKEGDVVENLPSIRANNIKAWVNIMYGCDKFCTYCIVPYTRGKQRSRLLEDIIAEVNELKDAGYKEITLLGQNVNAYGKDLNSDIEFAILLEEVAKTGIPRVRFTTSHPWDFSDKMIEVAAKYSNIMPYIHLPVQSGNDEILKLMGRRYSSRQYLEIYDKIKAAIPHVSFSTDIIVGFPNETDEQYQDTLDLCHHCQFDNAYTFVYSPRDGTPAASMIDNIDIDTKNQRLYKLNEVINTYASINNKAYEGKIVKVLVEGTSKKNDKVLSGYTETNKLVNFTGGESLIGQIVEVEITQAKTWALTGKVFNG